MQYVQKLSAWLILMTTFVGVYFFLEYWDLPTAQVFSYAILLMPLWLPYIMFFLFHEHWVSFVRMQANLNTPRVTLEIFLPQEIFKSPLAMELMLNQLFQTAGIDNHVQSYWEGKHPPTFSLELISTEGEVRFCINTQAKFKNIIEAQLYAQYPGIEIRELDIDYTAEIPHKSTKEGWSSHAFHYKLKKPDPYPIKTYVDYGLQDNPKEEEKIDPISVTLETLGALGPGEHMWLQFLIKANKGYDFKSGSLKKTDDWKGDVKKEMETIIENAKKRSGTEDGNGPAQLTDGEKDNLKCLERSLSKYAFDSFVRGIYVAKGDNFNGGRIGTLAAILRPFDDVSRNALGIVWDTSVNWPWWQDKGGRKTDRWRDEEIEDYKKRGYNPRHKGDSGMVLTTEELATVFHLPGSVVLTPNVRRIGSLRSEAPGNLPT